MNVTVLLAWRNLWRHPRRTWLTLGAMVFSNVLLVFMISLQFGMYRLMIENTLLTFTGHLQVQAEGYNDNKKMRQIVPDIQALSTRLREKLTLNTVSPRAMAFVLASSKDRTYGIQVLGVDPEHEPLVSSIPGLVEDGRYLQASDTAEVFIGRVLARNLRINVGDELTLLGSGRDGSLAAAVVVVAGIFESGVTDLDRSIAEIPLTFFQDTFFMRGAGHQIVITTPDLSLVNKTVAAVDSILPKDEGLVTLDWNVLQPGLKQAIQADISSAFFMYGVLVVLVAFSVLNTQLMSVLERTHEFGIVMALGISPGHLGRLVMLETAMMGTIGLFAGAFLGGLVTLWFSYNGFSYPGMEDMAANFNLPSRFYPQVTVLAMFLGPLVVFLFTVLSALYPALRLNWLHPVAAMRAA
ncbi:MAG: ABC transporter permease [Gammaproteobacteria bacterium]|nr:ABC transporter permease [Gammaproteobacteria bacterium]